MLLVALASQAGFVLPAERTPTWYGFSADTAQRGLKELQEYALLRRDEGYRKEPLAPAGYTQVHRYTLLGPFKRPTSKPSTED